jgi:hypothetical protein
LSIAMSNMLNQEEHVYMYVCMHACNVM